MDIVQTDVGRDRQGKGLLQDKKFTNKTFRVDRSNKKREEKIID